MDTSLVTGGAGFMGSHLTDELVAMGHDVIVLDDLSGGFRRNVNPRAHFVEGSILDHDRIDALFCTHKIDWVFHLAAYAAEGLSPFIKRYNYRNNLIGSVNLINAAVNNDVRCFVFTSSIAVYGHGACPMTEEMPPNPVDSYGIAKYAVEKELAVSRDFFGLNHIIFRPHNVYGERQNIGDRYRNVVGIFMNQIMTGKPLTIFGDGEQQRAFSYIKDVAPVIARSVHTPEAYNRIFNIGTDSPATVNQLAGDIMRAMGKTVALQYLEEREEVKTAWASHEKLARVFKSRPRFDLPQGLDRMAAWALRHGARRSKRFGGIEIHKNLPPSWRE